MTGQITALAVLSNALDLGKPVVETACGLVDSLLGEPCKVAGNMLADQVYYWQWRNRVRMAHRAKEMMDQDRIAPRVLPNGFLIPLLDAAGNVEEPDLQEMWARLLVSGIESDEHCHPGFVQVLSQFGGLDASILERCKEAIIDRDEFLYAPQGDPKFRPIGVDLLGVARFNLIRLGVCEAVTATQIRLTGYGRAFLAACRT